MNVIGIDPSLTSTGVCHPDGATESWATKTRGAERLAWFAGQMSLLISRAKPDVILIEGYSYGSKNSREVLGELGGVFRLTMWQNNVPFVVVPPHSRTKYATGKGAAHKDFVVSAVTTFAGRMFVNSDEADAWVLWQMGMAHYAPNHDLTLKGLSASHTDAMAKVEWATVAGVAA